MLDSLFDLVANLLNFFYGLVPNYAVAIALLTCAVMLITTPLTLKGTRGMIEAQRIQPEIRRLRAQYRDDKQKLNEEMMRLYREHQINPLGGCLPLLIQLPAFSILFYVIRGLTNEGSFLGVQRFVAQLGGVAAPAGGFDPKYLDHSTELYQSLHGADEMQSFGIDLAISPLQSLEDGFLTALPYVLIVGVIGLLSWYQQKQIMGRNRYGEANQQQQLLMRIGPPMYVMFAFWSPAALCIYFLVSTVWRVGQQAFITQAFYKGEHSLGAQSQKALAEARAEAKREGGNGTGKAKGATKAARAAKATKSTGRAKAGAGGGKRTTSRNGSGEATPAKRRASGAAARTRDQASGAAAPQATGGSGTRPKPHPRSRKKKKRK